MSPRKVRLVTNLIKGMEANEAKVQLRFLPKKASEPIAKLLNSALANAENNFNLSKDNLYIEKILVGQGASLKRWMPRAFGRATPVLKRTSHITIFLNERWPGKKAGKNVKKKTEPEIQQDEKKEERPAEELKQIKTKIVPKSKSNEVKRKKGIFGWQQLGNLKKSFRRKSV